MYILIKSVFDIPIGAEFKIDDHNRYWNWDYPKFMLTKETVENNPEYFKKYEEEAPDKWNFNLLDAVSYRKSYNESHDEFFNMQFTASKAAEISKENKNHDFLNIISGIKKMAKCGRYRTSDTKQHIEPYIKRLQMLGYNITERDGMYVTSWGEKVDVDKETSLFEIDSFWFEERLYQKGVNEFTTMPFVNDKGSSIAEYFGLNNLHIATEIRSIKRLSDGKVFILKHSQK